MRSRLIDTLRIEPCSDITHDRMRASVRAFAVLAPEPMARLTILIEMLGGLAVLLGAFITLFSVP